ncbi:MAG TPA: amino acid adenylation domain-containing protein [Pyrinomonadaceae bacterium]|nr:amino acid adenylation domain-containing protein [Pyrinomonadaceae bacterium]
MSEHLDKLGELTPDQQALLLRMLQKKAQARAEQRIPRVTSGGRQPLSFAQERLWLVDQFEPNTSTYNIPGGVRLTGSLQVAGFEQSLREMVRRHEALRTSFVDVAGQPVQQIAADLSHGLTLIDLQGLNADQQEQQAQRLRREEARRPFDLRRAPLLRVCLLQLSEQEHQFLFTMHHIISDGWSMSALVREVGGLYPAYSSGSLSPLPELEIQYADFAVWQRERLQGDVLDQELTYWKQQLADAPELLELPLDRPRPRLGSSRGSSESFVLSESVSRGLRELTQQSNTTLFMTLLAAFKTLLYRYTGQTDILVGTPVANRNRLQIEPLIGFFVNTLVLRTRVTPESSFRDLLPHVRDVVLGAQNHQELPFDRLVQELAPERSLSHAPLFQVMMVVDTTPARRLELPELELQAIATDLATAKFDMTLALNTKRESGELTGVIEFNTDLFDRDRIARLAEHFSALLSAVVENPDQSLAQLPLLSASERQQLLVEWNDTKRPCSSYCIHELFAAQAQQRPDAIAVVSDNQQITYEELDARSNDLAHRLRQLGAGVESSIAICVERSIERIVGLLGILKAGGVYVPLDSDYPTDRLSFMLDNSQIAVLLTDDKTAMRMAELASDTIPQLNLDHQVITNPTPVALADSFYAGEQLAYIVYTSGSTGQPKGVSIAHKSVARLVNGAAYVRFTPNDVYLHLSSLSFDAATFDIWGALLNGGRVALMTPGPPSVEELAKVLKRDQITTVFLTTALFNLMVQEQPAALASIPEVLAGGENVSIVHVHNHLAAMAAAEAGISERYRFVHVYGPTEVTTFSTGEAMTSKIQNPATVSIGRPIANTTAYVLDSQLQPVPVGVYGELYLGGLGLARGYYGQTSLTAERFVPDVFSGEPGARLYRTGDVVRQLSDGRIEFLGRTDHQIKLRGFRIELGEVEAAVTHAEGVRQAIVLMREDTPGDKRLVAYVVPETEEFSIAELRRQLHTELPDYMVPAAFVLLEELPLNPNGKVNRKELPVPESSGSATSYVPPRTPTEQIVADIWSEVLKIKQVGVEDNFFELGGHSLLAAQVISRVRTACKVEVPLRALFEAGTVAALSQVIEEEAQRKLEMLPPLVSVNREGPLPLSFAQERLWFLNQFEPQSAFYNIPVALRLRGPLSIAALESTLNEMTRRHEVLRTTFTRVGGKPEQFIGAVRPRPLPVIDLVGLTAEQRETAVQNAIREDARTPFDLVLGPLVRQHVLRVTEDEHVVLLTMHHIVTDGWSMDVLVKEVVALYAMYRRGESSPLPELEIQYADFAVWQRDWLQGDVLDDELSYWTHQLAHAPEVLELPTDRPRPRHQSFRGAYQSLGFSADIARRLTEVSQQQGTTLFMTLLAAFKTLLYRYTGQTDLLVGTPVANRNRVEIEPLIGFFVNTLVLRTRVAGEFTFSDVLSRVREVVLEAQGHQELPFERLVQELAPDRSLSHAPLFQVTMVLNNPSAQKLELPELELQAVGGDSATAKFDMTLALASNESGIVGRIVYNRDLFGSARMAQFAGHFTRVVESVCREPGQKLWQVEMLSEAELYQIMVTWNDTHVDNTYPQVLPELLNSQAVQFADAVALSFKDEQVSYEELQRRSNQVARWLQQLGVGPETLIGLFTERSLEMVTGMLGTLKAGGAYLPLDPEYPKDRLAYMLDDARPHLLLTQQRLLNRLPHHGARVVCLDADWDQIDMQDDGAVEAGIAADNPAYVIYTSGSTGRPKGAVISHRAICNHTVWMQSVLPQRADDCLLQKTPFSFDASVWEFFAPLFVGARLVMAEPSRHQEPDYLARTINREGVTIIQMVPSLLRALLQERELRQCRSLRRVFCGGEALSRDLHEGLAAQLDAQLINLYGPTEATIDSLYWVCPTADEDEYLEEQAA